MKLFAPKYYKNFVCIADRCRHSCCIKEQNGNRFALFYPSRRLGMESMRLRAVRFAQNRLRIR